jgi:hypothetical protein
LINILEFLVALLALALPQWLNDLTVMSLGHVDLPLLVIHEVRGRVSGQLELFERHIASGANHTLHVLTTHGTRDIISQRTHAKHTDTTGASVVAGTKGHQSLALSHRLRADNAHFLPRLKLILGERRDGQQSLSPLLTLLVTGSLHANNTRGRTGTGAASASARGGRGLMSVLLGRSMATMGTR